MTVGRTANVHGVAVAAGDLGLLILGDGGSGKSALAARMIADWPFGEVRLVADDRVLLARFGDRIVARPHPAIAGAMELRGHGLIRPPALDAVVLAGALRLSADRPERFPEPGGTVEDVLGVSLPCAILPQADAAFRRLITIWPYLRGRMENSRSNLMPAP